MNDTTNPPESRGHHPDSPSGLQSSDACPHFENRQGDSEASLAGTLQHAAVEKNSYAELENQEQIDAVRRCLALGEKEFAALNEAGFAVDVIRERYLAVCPDEVVNDGEREWRGITGGYPDLVLLAKGPEGMLILVVDWKFGQNLVTPTADNLQAIAYSLALLQQYPEASEVKFTFYHPNIEFDVLKDEYTHVFTRDDMPEMELKIRLVLAKKHRARQGWDAIAPQPAASLCVWCAKLATCPAVTALGVATHAKHERLVVPLEVRANYLTDPAMMRQAYQLTHVLESFAKQVRKRVTDAVLTEGVVVPGMRIVTKADRTVTSIAAAKEAAAQAGIVGPEFEALLSLTLGSLEKAVKAKAPKGKGALAVRELAELLADHGAVEKGASYSYLTEDKGDAPIDI